MARLESFGFSDIGTVRPNNEDAFVVDPVLSLFAVADGMGGHAAGEVAARIAIETVAGVLRDQSADAPADGWCRPWSALSSCASRLRTAICLANERILEEASLRHECTGMGTTIVSALVRGNRVTIGHVGDSRLYLLSHDGFTAQTRDDTWAASLLADGTIDRRRVASHPLRNVLTNVLGAREQMEVHLSERTLQDGDMLLLCSDGVHNVLDEEALQGLLSQPSTVERIVQSIVAAAIGVGSRDNATAVVVRYTDE